MSIFKHHEHGNANEEETAKPDSKAEESEDGAAHDEYYDGTENPIAREHDEAVAREIRTNTPMRPPGI